MIQLTGYVVQQLLRETEHSHVYQGLRVADQLPVAIKVARTASPESHAAAQQELEIIRRLDGLPVVHAIELADVEDRPALVMARFAGVGLDEWLRGRTVELDAFLRIAAALASALGGIHERGILHRDLRPANLLIDPERLDVCVADFGVAARLDGEMSIQAAAMIGSLAYLAPEQTGRMNRRVDRRSDLYALGVTLYQLITGRLPFVAASPLELVHAHVAHPPRPPCELDPRIPPAVSALIGKLLAKGPDDRYQSAEGVAADLQALAAQRAAHQALGGFPLGRRDRARTFLLPSKLYGRAAELAVLERCLAAAGDGVVQLLAVGGASGAGKTALFGEAEHRLALQRGHLCRGKFDRLAHNVPFSAIGQALAGLVDQLLAKSDRELDDIRAAVARRLAGLGQIILEIAPAVAKLIGPQPAVPAVGLLESRGRITDAFRRFITALATRERPLVLVLDDLQWADAGSLLLLEALLAAGRRGGPVALVVLAAYRPAEVPAGHPFRRVLDGWGTPTGSAAEGRRGSIDGAARSGAALHELALGPLDAGHVAELLADTLRMPVADLAELAGVVLGKTGGNPFFVHQFLAHAHRQGLVTFAGEAGWRWDLDAIQAAGIPDDAAGLMTEKIRSLAPEVQRALVDASVIGDELDLASLLAVTAGGEPEVRAALHRLIGDGLLVGSGGGYRFAHDKIREAALGLGSAEHVSRIHVAVGRHRLRALGAGDGRAGPGGGSGAQICAIADHLNHGHPQLAGAERIDVAALNLRAAKHALGIGAIGTARPYLEAGLRLLDGTAPPSGGAAGRGAPTDDGTAPPSGGAAGRGTPTDDGTAPPSGGAAGRGAPTDEGGDPWRHFQLRFELTLEHANVRFYAGETEAAIAVFHDLLARDLSLVNRAAVSIRLIGARLFREQYDQGCREGIAALAAFGVEIPPRATPRRAVFETLRALWAIGARPERLLELPVASDDVVHARNELISTTSFPFYLVNTKLAAILWSKAVARLRHDGLDLAAPIQLISFAVILGTALNRPALARRFAQVAGELHDRLGPSRHTANFLFLRYQLLEPWHAPYRASLPHLDLAIQRALDVGDHLNVTVCHTSRLYCALTEGVSLAAVERMGQEAHDTTLRVGLQREIHVIASLREVTSQLRDRPVAAQPEDWYATPAFARLQPRRVNFHMVATSQILVLLLRGEHGAAFELAQRICPAVFREARGAILVWVAWVALGVGAASRLPGARGAERRRYRKHLDRSLAKLRRWVAYNPVFFTHKVRWLEAEAARARGRAAAALALYVQARDEAIAAGYPHLGAAIDLRCGTLAVERGLAGEAALRFGAAIQAYRAWGARALVTELEQRHPGHAVAAPAGSFPDAGSGERTLDAVTATLAGRESSANLTRTPSEHLDLGALVGASQAIAQGVTLASVLERVMANTMAAAGATLGVVLLERDGALHVELRQRAGGPLERCATLLDDDDDLPHAIVRLVRHGGEAVVLEDAARRGGFVGDPWVRARAAKSILCAPIVTQARRVGVLFLHNELVAGAFTERHLITVQMLSTQAAISIDNAILYDELSTLNRDLEARVEDRTRALREAQQLLLVSARKAGMADVAINVLHNVGNALNSVSVSAQLIQGQIAASKVKTLARVLALVDEHRHDLAGFVASDPRGQKLAPMLSLLGGALTGEQDTMQAELVRLRASVEAIGQVVRELEVTADDKGIAIVDAPQRVLGEAIAAVRERSVREAVAIAADSHELPGARVDKLKAVEILIGLLDNALDAVAAVAPSGEPGTVSVGLRCRPDAVVFEVADNGAGIAAENLTRIFHGGFSTKPERRGANLHRFANFAASVGGTLTAASPGPGGGATFVLTLPNRGGPRPDRGSRDEPSPTERLRAAGAA